MSINLAKIRETAESLLDEYKVTSAPVNPQLLANALGLTVSYVHFNDDLKDKLFGFIDLDDRKIFVNHDIKNSEKLFTIAHELGHFKLHRDWAESENYRVLTFQTYKDPQPKKEQEADAFASFLLIPRKILHRYENIASVEELSRLFCVSEAQVLNALKCS